MAVPYEAVTVAMAGIAVVSLLLHRHVAKAAGTLFFTYVSAISAAAGLSIVAYMLYDRWFPAQAFVDIGILMAGLAAFAAAGWLDSAFRIAGDTDDR